LRKLRFSGVHVNSVKNPSHTILWRVSQSSRTTLSSTFQSICRLRVIGASSPNVRHDTASRESSFRTRHGTWVGRWKGHFKPRRAGILRFVALATRHEAKEVQTLCDHKGLRTCIPIFVFHSSAMFSSLVSLLPSLQLNLSHNSPTPPPPPFNPNDSPEEVAAEREGEPMEEPDDIPTKKSGRVKSPTEVSWLTIFHRPTHN